MTKERIKRKTITEEIVANIKRMIIRDSLRPGDRLPTEHELADRFGVSRISVREATKALSFMGIVESLPGRGMILSKLDMKKVTGFLGFHFALNKYPKQKLLQARAAIEVGALRQVVLNMGQNPDIYKSLQAVIDKFDTINGGDELIEVDNEFHRTLLEASEIEPLVVFTDLLEIFFKRFRQEVMNGSENWEKGKRDHRMLVENLKEGRLEQAEKILINHLVYEL